MIGVTEKVFDDTGTPGNFCRDCEHAPCVAGARGRCCARPRFIVAFAIRDEVFTLVDRVAGPGRSDKALTHDAEVRNILTLAVYGLGDAALEADWYGADALKSLVRVRTKLQTLVAS